MSLELVPGGLLNLLGSLVIVALAVAVARVKPRGAPQAWFSAFALCFGVGTGLTNVNVVDIPLGQDLLYVAVTVLLVGGISSLVGLGLAYAGLPQRRSSRLLIGGAALVMLAVAWGLLAVDRAGIPAFIDAAGIAWTPVLWFTFPVFLLHHVASWSVAFAFALWARAGDAARVRQAALMSSAVILYSGWYGTAAYTVPHVGLQGAVAISFVGGPILCALWLAVTRKGVASAAARNAALVPLVAILLGLAFHVRNAPWSGGVSRILMTAILAYAVVRHKALGIDAKVRIGISKSTVAAVFIAVFFVVSEAAQEFFGAAAGSQYVGIVAAGGLLFVLAPLQRVADRLAEKAVPTTPRRPHDSPGNLQVFHQLAQRLAADGELSAHDRRTLAYVAQEMGIGPGEFHDAIEKKAR